MGPYGDHLVLERDHARLDDFNGEVRHRLRYGVLELCESVPNLREQLSGDNETDINSTEEVSASKLKKKPAVKSSASVENVSAKKIKVMKDLNKKEIEVMKSIDGLDRETSDLKKKEKIIELKKKEKIKELKAIQKERRAVLNA